VGDSLLGTYEARATAGDASGARGPRLPGRVPDRRADLGASPTVVER
jgi:hypothetical protein